MVMVIVDLGHGLDALEGQAARREGEGNRAELGEELTGGDVCCTLDLLSQASLLWLTPGLDVPVRESPEEIPGCLFLGSGTDGFTLSWRVWRVSPTLCWSQWPSRSNN